MKKCFVIALFAFVLIIQSCKKDNTLTMDSDLYDEIKNTNGYIYYVGTPDITPGLGNSAHRFERVRFNAIAEAALDSTGKLPSGVSFPSGSIIVKENYSSASGGLTLLSVMKKDPTNANAGSGYLWAEFKPDGSATFSIAKKGDGCISCHSGSVNRDLIRTFNLH